MRAIERICVFMDRSTENSYCGRLRDCREFKLFNALHNKLGRIYFLNSANILIHD